MAKRKHPTAKSLRQGQTVYFLRTIYDGDDYDSPYHRVVITYFLHSHKMALPPMGTMITAMPVSKVRKALLERPKFYSSLLFYSKRRAVNAAKERS